MHNSTHTPSYLVTLAHSHTLALACTRIFSHTLARHQSQALTLTSTYVYTLEHLQALIYIHTPTFVHTHDIAHTPKPSYVHLYTLCVDMVAHLVMHSCTDVHTSLHLNANAHMNVLARACRNTHTHDVLMHGHHTHGHIHTLKHALRHTCICQYMQAYTHTFT